MFPQVAFNSFPSPLAALSKASLAITFDLDIRGFLPARGRCIEFALAKVVESLLAMLWFFTGTGILLPLVVVCADAIDDLFLEPRDEGAILDFDAAGLVEVFTFVTVGSGILLAIAGAEAFPRFHTL